MSRSSLTTGPTFEKEVLHDEQETMNAGDFLSRAVAAGPLHFGH